MDNSILDNMATESKIWKIPMILFFILAVLFPLGLIWNQLKTIEFVLGELFLIALGCFFLYEYLYAFKYHIIISNEKILLKTLFRKIEVNISEIKYYTCKRYRKSVFYQFWLYLDGKKVLINTRYKDEFKEILNQKEIEERTIK